MWSDRECGRCLHAQTMPRPARVPGSEAPRQTPTGRSSGLRLVATPEQPSPRAARHRAEVASGSSFWPITAAALRRNHTDFPLRHTRSHGWNLSSRQRCYRSQRRKARRMGRLMLGQRSRPLRFTPLFRDAGRLGGQPSTPPPCDRRRLRRRAARTQLKRAWESFRNSANSRTSSASEKT
jgi:hypothetical protein